MAEAGPDCWLYAVRAKGDAYAPVKFGIAVSFENRVRQLQTGSPYPLAKLAWVPGGRPLEAAIHSILAPWRTSGEWFVAVDDDAMTRFAKWLKDRDFRHALLRWHALPCDFKPHVRRMIGKEKDADWLQFIAVEDHGCGLPRLIHFIDQCAKHGRTEEGEGTRA